MRIDYSVRPKESVVAVESNGIDNGYFKADVYDDGGEEDYGTGHIIITSLKEASQNVIVKINAYNPQDGNAICGTKQLNLTFKYDRVNANIALTNKDGNFSNYIDNSKTLNIGDGETVTMCFNILETDANAYLNVQGSGFDIREVTPQNVKDKKYYSIKLSEDVISYDYKIESLLVPYYNDFAVNWQDDFRWRCWYKNNSGFFGAGATRDDYFGLARISTYKNVRPEYTSNSGTAGYDAEVTWYYWTNDSKSSSWHTNCKWTLKKDDSWTGRIISKEDFKNYAWLYCPGTPSYSSENDIWVTYQDFQNGTRVQGGYGGGHTVNVSEHIMTEHVSVTEVPSTDKTSTESINKGNIIVTVYHNGKEQERIYITVYLNTYNCPKNQN